MRWFTHKSVAVAGALWLGAPVAALVAVALGSILPDTLDQAIAGRNQSLWRRIHRGTTHWLGWYLLVIIGGQLFGAGPEARLAGDLVSGLGLGAASHVLLDALNPSGVPLSPWGGKPRFSLNLVSTGSWGERVFLVCALALVGVQFTSVEQIIRTLLR